MTIIAWDGRILAADKRVNDAGLARTCTKIFKVDLQYEDEPDVPGFAAIVGSVDPAMELLEWFIAGAAQDKFPEAARKDDATLIVISSDPAVGVRQWNTGPYPTAIEDRFSAWGSGRDYALAAMHLGHTAREGVELACLFEMNCGNGIDTLSFEEVA
jgi:hypothetical protein